MRFIRKLGAIVCVLGLAGHALAAEAPAQLEIHLVLHGDAATALRVDAAYQKAVDDPFTLNYNARITQDLLNLGVAWKSVTA